MGIRVGCGCHAAEVASEDAGAADADRSERGGKSPGSDAAMTVQPTAVPAVPSTVNSGLGIARILTSRAIAQF